ncbi:MAG TPA: 6-phosphofructokinase [Candidatus Thermoplasmatota archaeon]|nr:6-phosphofructokinase [Candidatus Thermoplasmatota archaeon]
MNQGKYIGVLTSGGDAPGMNAAIRAVVRTGLDHGNTLFGIKRGYQGMIEGDIEQLNRYSVSNIIKDGGTILQTARSSEFLTKEGREKAFKNLKRFGIDSIIVIGGDGSFRGLHQLTQEFPIQGIGVPGTIDNDLFGTDFTIGFDTAVNTALEAIDKIRDTASSHSRLFIIEVMGRTSGYIALYTGIGGGAEDILIPEAPMEIQKLITELDTQHKAGKQSSIIVIAEGETSGGAAEIKTAVEKVINWDIKVSVLGHVQRGGDPSAFDRVLASRLGYESVLAVMNNQNDKMVGMAKNTATLTPLEETWTKKKDMDMTYLKMNEVLAGQQQKTVEIVA